MDFPVDRLTEEQIRYFLPKGYLAYGDFISTAGLFALVEHFGGTRVRIPVQPKPGHYLLDALTQDDLVSLSQGAGGLYLDVPLAPRLQRIRRAFALQQSKEAGRTIPQLAREFCTTQREVYRLQQDYLDWIKRFPRLAIEGMHQQGGETAHTTTREEPTHEPHRTISRNRKDA